MNKKILKDLNRFEDQHKPHFGVVGRDYELGLVDAAKFIREHMMHQYCSTSNISVAAIMAELFATTSTIIENHREEK